MAGAVMGATSDYTMYGDINHNHCQIYPSAGINTSLGVMPTNSSFQACHEKARNYMAQSTSARKITLENHYIEVGSSSSSNNVEAAQLELADVLRGILDEQQAELANHNTNYNLSDYCLNSLIKATTSPSNHQCNQSVISTAHDADSSLLINPDMQLDVETLHQATHGQTCISKYDIAASNTLIDAESLLVIANPFNLDAPDHQSLSPTASAAQCDYSRLTCINSSISCSTNDHLSCKSTSSNILQGYNDDDQLEPIDMDASCRVPTSAHDSFDDYSLSTINGGAVLGCNSELLPSKMGSSRLEVLNADAGKAFEIIDDDDGDNNCHDQNTTVIAVHDMTTHDHGENVCNKEELHVVSHHLDSNIDDDINKGVRDAGGIASYTHEYGMVSTCNEEDLYPSGGHMKLIQREAAYAAAAMQPVDWAGVLAVTVGARPKRRNVRISQDPQTVSARRRRERISDRIRVLQRMVPGGTKLDTASMLDEAIHYLKYLKSQVQALEWLERRSSPSITSNLSFASSPSPYCLYPNFNTSYIQPSPSSRLMIIK